jgi:hypothetical protein
MPQPQRNHGSKLLIVLVQSILPNVLLSLGITAEWIIAGGENSTCAGGTEKRGEPGEKSEVY